MQFYSEPYIYIDGSDTQTHCLPVSFLAQLVFYLSQIAVSTYG